MPSEKDRIDEMLHTGSVLRLLSPGKVRVKIADASQCGTCAAASLCSMGSKKQGTELDVSVPASLQVGVGDKVEIAGTEQLHKKAIRLATLYPTLAILAVMIGVYLLTGNQLAAAFSGIGTMILFFVTLWLFRNKIEHEFSFSVKRVIRKDSL